MAWTSHPGWQFPLGQRVLYAALELLGFMGEEKHGVLKAQALDASRSGVNSAFTFYSLGGPGDLIYCLGSGFFICSNG